MGTRKHLLSENITFDNYGTTHIVNDRKFLKTNSFILLIGRKVVYASITNFPIAETRVKIIKDTFRNQDLKLLDITFVKGFYVNIIIKARLRNLKVWYYKLDYILRLKDLINNRKVKTLVHKYNLIFFEYKFIFSFYFMKISTISGLFLKRIPVSLYKTFMLSTTRNRSFRRS
jgi:hypothetical protein